jgi:hypothetical protein
MDSAAANPAASAAAAPESLQLTFDWSRPRRGMLRLAGFILASLAAHAIFFYLFKVVTPTARRKYPPEENLLWLSSGNAQAQNVLRSLEDRSPAVTLLGSASAVGEDAEMLRRMAPNYTPSFASYRPALKEVPLPGASQPNFSAVLGEAGGILPPLAKAAQGQSATPAVPAPPAPAPLSQTDRIHFNLSAVLAARGLEKPPVWPQGLASAEDTDFACTFQVAIDPSGAVRYCLAETGTPPAELQRAVAALRFRPRIAPRQSALEWGAVEVFW